MKRFTLTAIALLATTTLACDPGAAPNGTNRTIDADGLNAELKVPTCAAVCENAELNAYLSCVYDGAISGPDCRIVAKQAAQICAASTCEQPAPIDITEVDGQCYQQCGATATGAEERCLDSDNHTPHCALVDTYTHIACIEVACLGETAHPAPTCEERCDAAALRVYQGCIQTSGTVPCRRRAEIDAAQCQAACAN